MVPRPSLSSAHAQTTVRMGFFASYKRLSRKARIILGLVGVVIGLAGPYIVPLLPAVDKPDGKLPLNEETAARETALPWSDTLLLTRTRELKSRRALRWIRWRKRREKYQKRKTTVPHLLWWSNIWWLFKSEPLQLSLQLKCTFNLLYVHTELCQSRRKIEIHSTSGLVNFSFDLTWMLLTNMTAMMVIRGQMPTKCSWIPES